MLSCSTDRSVLLWDIRADAIQGKIPARNASQCVCFDYQGSIFAVSTEPGLIQARHSGAVGELGAPTGFPRSPALVVQQRGGPAMPPQDVSLCISLRLQLFDMRKYHEGAFMNLKVNDATVPFSHISPSFDGKQILGVADSSIYVLDSFDGPVIAKARAGAASGAWHSGAVRGATQRSSAASDPWYLPVSTAHRLHPAD